MSTSKRDEVLEQLVVFLKDKNKKTNCLSIFFRHPFTLMVFGTIAVAIMTNIWTSREQRNLLELQWQRAILEKKLDLYESLQTNFHQSGSYVNTWFQMVIGFARESLKPLQDQNKQRIDFYKNRGMEAERQFMTSTPFGSQLDQVRVIFASGNVIVEANKFDEKWSSYIEKLHECNRYLNTRSYTADHLDEWDNYRKDTIDELTELNNNLTKHMGHELTTFYH